MCIFHYQGDHSSALFCRLIHPPLSHWHCIKQWTPVTMVTCTNIFYSHYTDVMCADWWRWWISNRFPTPLPDKKGPIWLISQDIISLLQCDLPYWAGGHTLGMLTTIMYYTISSTITHNTGVCHTLLHILSCCGKETLMTHVHSMTATQTHTMYFHTFWIRSTQPVLGVWRWKQKMIEGTKLRA